LRDDDPDYAALVMGNYIIGGGFLNSRLATRIRQKEGISYGVGSWLQQIRWISQDLSDPMPFTIRIIQVNWLQHTRKNLTK
jgi:predicted Zn-dependent peptidase